MGRMFVIRESYPDDGSAFDPTGQPRITEAELKRRLALCSEAFTKDEDIEPRIDLDQAINILLHGEGEVRNRTAEEAEAEHKFHKEHWGKGDDRPTLCPMCGKYHSWNDMCRDDMCRTTQPTREEWECPTCKDAQPDSLDYTCKDCGRIIKGIGKLSPTPTRKGSEMERRFVITEMYDDVDVVQIGDGRLVFRNRIPCISESELRRRWDAAHIAMEKSNTPWQTALDIMLHGRGSAYAVLHGEGEGGDDAKVSDGRNNGSR